jgi:hypothetical protein
MPSVPSHHRRPARKPARLLVWLAPVLVAGCSGAGDATTTIPSTTAIGSPSTTEFVPPLTDCPPAPYQLGVLPERVSTKSVDPLDVEQDQFTSMAGTHSAFWLGDSGEMVLALIRGSLPPAEWPGAKGAVDIDGAEAVAGQYADGTWVIGWFEPPGERCDLYTMVFYQPVEAAEVEGVLASMDRVAG